MHSEDEASCYARKRYEPPRDLTASLPESLGMRQGKRRIAVASAKIRVIKLTA